MKIELNGVANMICILDMALEKKDITKSVYDELKIQLDTLERYMIEAANQYCEGHYPTPWHEVRDNKNKYPLNNGRTK